MILQYNAKLSYGEPQLASITPETNLEDCELAMEKLMGLMSDAREMQRAHSRLMQQTHQITLPHSPHTSPTTGQPVFSFAEDGDVEVEVQSTYMDLVRRFSTSEKYIWEFIDRLEARRRCLHTSIIFYSEATVVSHP
ncbi:unnamed protein product [Dibothriocephalus latus]|uniref:Uncharacterized protein n=1 Tax=Dibothriocephalus latus TaxID=60516 RepID=A0A3P7MG94_DIBLA|nr:unnamed protein product [Dibothriocephalus latus]